MKRRILIVLVVLVALLLVGAWITFGGGEHEGPGEVTAVPSPPEVVADRIERQAVHTGPNRQILFGDLHVHTTFSADAFMRSLPMTGGQGAHPPADACDFARYCSALDFFAITDHAESLTKQHWDETIDSLRQCEAVTGDVEDPDLLVFAGWEWSQVGMTAETHWGHRNVILRGLGEEDIPTRPIASQGLLRQMTKNTGISRLAQLSIPLRDFANRQRYLNFTVYRDELMSRDTCPEGVASPDLPAACAETAATPGDLFRKLDEWDVEALVIPHGTTWGFYTPPGYVWDKALMADNQSPERDRLIEIYSGHGNSEEYRSWLAEERVAEGRPMCPEPSDDYTPCCWRAGELIRERCGGIEEGVCNARVAEARTLYLESEAAGHLTVTGSTLDDWGSCGQCEDCFNPAFNYRPGGSVQYALARGNFDDPENPIHARYGFIASSDNHTARPGTGYKEFARMAMTEAAGPVSEEWRDLVLGPPPEPTPEPADARPDNVDDIAPFRLVHLERQSSFFMTGGLVAVHADGRNRDAVWDAMQRREVYGTSGPRILLWFDLLNGPNGRVPMGSEAAMSSAPRFEVRAVGAFKQREGCPEWVGETLEADRLAALCVNECYYPSDERYTIERIEIVRIRPQLHDGEWIADLIDDPWQVHECEASQAGCVATFQDLELVSGGREVVYYARAVQEASDAVNADGLRCDEAGCDPCYGDYRTDRGDDCLSQNQERAWSSPIFIDALEPPPVPPAPAAPASLPSVQ